ncbi:MAG: hypothetical protein ACD_39C01859G0003 [uncultured bacterium]|nr:MAG: hypothetical protein ACD_39C01859G0003 [uncultured bacterium]
MFCCRALVDFFIEKSSLNNIRYVKLHRPVVSNKPRNGHDQPKDIVVLSEGIMEILQLSVEELFFQISVECCADGKVSADEFNLLRKISALLGLDKDKANEIANRAVGLFKSGQLPKARKTTPDQLYQELLIKLCADGILDAEEDAVLQSLKQLLGCDVSRFQKLDCKDDQRKIRLKPLLCSNCKGLLPLEKKEWIDCPYCAKKNSIPVSYLDAIATRASLNRHQSKLHEIKDVVGRMPTFFESVISYFPDSLVFFLFALFLMFFQHYINMLLFFPASLYYKKYLLQSFYDFSSPMLLAFMKVSVLYVLLSIPFAFIYKTKRKIAVLGPLQISLAAGPPKIPGGPATCNNCGAALVVKHDSHFVSCGYCETENLVGLPENWLQTARSRLSGVQKSATEAIQNFKKETGRLYETLLSLAILFVIYGFILGSFYATDRSNHFLPLISADQAHRKVIHTDKAANPALSFGEWGHITLSHAQTSREFVDLYFFMNAGEMVKVSWKPDLEHYKELQAQTYFLKDQPEPDRMNFGFFLTFSYNRAGKNVMEQLASIEMTAERAYELKAEISGYHHLRCFFPEHLFKFYLNISRVE